MDVAQPPKQRLPLEPVIDSPDQVGKALEELAWLRSRKAAIEEAAAGKIRTIQAAALAEMRLTVGGVRVSFADRDQQLERAIRDYAATHQAALLDVGSKTRRFAFGKLAWRQQPETLAYAFDEATTLARIEEPHKQTFLQQLLSYLDGFKFAGLPIKLLLAVKVSVSLPTLKNLWKTGQLSATQIEALGLEVRPAADQLSIDVAEYSVLQEAE